MTAAPQPLDLSIVSVSKAFGSQKVLEGISVTIPDGQFTTLLGASGCGKTTLLRIIAGFEVPDSGSVHLGKQDLLALPSHKRPVNTVFQSYALFPHLRVYDNVAFGLRSRKVAEADVTRRVKEICEVLRLSEFTQRYPQQLSGGQRQRVALGRALINEPEVLLLDEPLSALDAALRHDVQVELKRIQRRYDITFILVTHDQDEAIAVSDRILVMNKGRIEQDGTPEQVYERPETRFVADFIGGANLIDAERLDGNRVRTKFGELPVSCTPTWVKGTVAIRPEDIEARTAAVPGGIPATVSERLFRGDHWELQVQAGGTTLRVVTDPDEVHQSGQAVWLELPLDDLLVLRD